MDGERRVAGKKRVRKTEAISSLSQAFVHVILWSEREHHQSVSEKPPQTDLRATRGGVGVPERTLHIFPV